MGIPYKRRRSSSGSVHTKKYKKGYKPVVPYKPKHLRVSYKKRLRSSTSTGMKHGGTTQCGTGCWKSYGKGPKGSKKRQGFIGKLSKLLPPQVQLKDDKFQISCASAVQAISVVANLYSPFDLYNYNGGQALATTHFGQNKVLLKDYKCIIAFTNQTNANIKVTLYDIIQRRDVSSGAATTIPCDTPANAWTYESTLNGSYASSNTAALPFDSQLFCKYFKVISSKDYRLSQGETGEHYIQGRMNKVWDHSTDASTTSGAFGNQNNYRGGFKGLTHWTLAVVQGFPTDNDNTTVTTSIAEVDFVTTTRYMYQQINTQNATATSSTNIAAAVGHVFNQGSGADATIANA